MKPFVLLAIAISAPALCLGQATQPDVPAPPAPTATQPDPAVVAVLDRVEAAGRKIESLAAKMVYRREQRLVDERSRRDGRIAYLRKPEPAPARDADKPAEPRERVFFRVQFDNLIVDDYVSKKKEIYAFDGRWLHELKESTRQLTHREIVPEGKLVDPTRLGKGPFPAPFGQRKDDVLANFTVRLLPPADGDPKDADHLELTPRPRSELASTYKRLDLFVSRQLNVPVRMVTVDASQVVVTADFSEVEINGKLSEKDFTLTRPPGFNESTERLQPTGP